MSFQTREAVITELRAIFPPGSQVRAVPSDPRRTPDGQTRTSIQVFSPQGDNISDAAAIAMRAREVRGPAVRGFFGGLGPAQQFVGEFSLALHGSSTALRLAPALTPAAPAAQQQRTRAQTRTR